MSRYIAITPARDEQDLLPNLIGSMTSQTWTADHWIIVDDGSADDTARIVDEAARKYPWIEVHHLPRERSRKPGGEGVIAEFLPIEMCQQYDFVMRVDADASFDSGFMENLRDEFTRDKQLGIASPTLYEPDGAEWKEIRQPEFHTRGAVKLYSIECFTAIGVLDPSIGWDTLDEVRAMVHGYHTRSFRHIKAKHHRPQGAAAGWGGRMGAGLAAYKVGYSPLFMVARAARHTFSTPVPFAGVLLLAGYIKGYLRGERRSAEPEVIEFIRREQRRRLLLQESLWR